MISDEQIFKKYPGFSFWAKKKRPIYLYFLLYYIFFAVLSFIFQNISILLLFFISWIGIILFQVFTRYDKGLAKYLNIHNENLRLFLFDDKIFNENSTPLFSTFTMLKLFKLKKKDIDKNLSNLRDNELASLICTITVFLAFIIFVLIQIKSGGV